MSASRTGLIGGRWVKDAPDHWSRLLADGRYLAVWPRPVRGEWKWEILSADGEARVLATGNATTCADAKRYAETAYKAGRYRR